jgi:hypothetical protein
MKVILILVFFMISLIAEDNSIVKLEEKPLKNEIDINNSFITKYEYGKMLYNNPRGIGCNTCHGNDAKGKKIVDFKHEYKKKIYNCELRVPSIKDVDYNSFSKKVNSKKNPNLKFAKEQVCEKLIYYANVMPTYFLVEDEIEAIYYYIQNIKKK